MRSNPLTVVRNHSEEDESDSIGTIVEVGGPGTLVVKNEVEEPIVA